MSRFSTLCRNKADLLYFDQAARAYSVLPVNCFEPCYGRYSCPACLHTCSTCCQNQLSPFCISACKSTAFISFVQDFCCFFTSVVLFSYRCTHVLAQYQKERLSSLNRITALVLPESLFLVFSLKPVHKKDIVYLINRAFFMRDR